MTIEEYKHLLKKGSLQRQYFEILQDGAPHCRKCAQQETGSEQLAEVVFKALGGGQKTGQELLSKPRDDIALSAENQQRGISGLESFKSQIRPLVYPLRYRREF